MTEATFEEAEQTTDKPKTKAKAPKKIPLAKPTPVDPAVTVEQVQAQLNYAQKIITILQQKVNEANGVIVQLEARVQIAQEDKENILKQVEVMGITPQ
jgi:glucose/arabinose dehydrogenase